ncbi:MAG: hypothetical protein K6G89_05195 [Clostridia bacterium]|nr:hypothetical protein [Clostridia bacterium]
MYDVLYLENEAGYIIENLNPTAEGYYYAWDQKNNKVIYLLDDLQTVYYPEDYKLNPSDCWITASTAAEMATLSDHGYNIALENDIDEPIELHNVVSINTLGFKCSNLTMTAGSASAETAYLIGSFGNTNITAGATNIVTSGTMTGLSVSGNSSVTVGGYVNSYSASGSVSSVVSSTGMVSSVASSSTSNITNNGIIRSNSGSGTTTGNSVNASAAGNVVNVSTKEGIESVRAQVASGLRNFEGETIKLSEDVQLNGIALAPISSYYRKEGKDVAQVWDPSANGGQGDWVTPNAAKNWFAGTFDGNGKTISGFSNNGFSISGLTAGVNKSSVAFGTSGEVYGEAIYGFFGSVYNATIKNVTIECNVDMTIDNVNKYVGDSVGALVGFASGSYLTIENCVVSGSVKGYDGVGGIVGRSYATTTTIKNCVNNASVVGVRHTGGIIGFASGNNVIFENVVNNGKVENLGWKYDEEVLSANDASHKNGAGYYVAAAAFCGTQYKGVKVSTYRTDGMDGFTNNGQVVLAGKDCNYLTLEKDSAWTDIAGY